MSETALIHRKVRHTVGVVWLVAGPATLATTAVASLSLVLWLPFWLAGMVLSVSFATWGCRLLR